MPFSLDDSDKLLFSVFAFPMLLSIDYNVIAGNVKRDFASDILLLFRGDEDTRNLAKPAFLLSISFCVDEVASIVVVWAHSKEILENALFCFETIV